MHPQPVHDVLNLGYLLGEVLRLSALLLALDRAFQRESAVVGRAVDFLQLLGWIVRKPCLDSVFNRAVQLGFLAGGLNVVLKPDVVNLDSVGDLVARRGLFGYIFCLLADVHAANNTGEGDSARAAILRHVYAVQIAFVEGVVYSDTVVGMLIAMATGEGL